MYAVFCCCTFSEIIIMTSYLLEVIIALKDDICHDGPNVCRIRVVVTIEQTEEDIEKAASCIREAALAILK